MIDASALTHAMQQACLAEQARRRAAGLDADCIDFHPEVLYEGGFGRPFLRLTLTWRDNSTSEVDVPLPLEIAARFPTVEARH